MFAGVMGGKPAAGSPRSAAVWWKSETRWSRFPVVGRGERGAGVPILEGPSRWEAMSGGEGGDARPNNEDEKLWGRRSYAERRGVEKCRGGERGERKRGALSDRVSSLYRLFTPTTLTLVTHNSSHTVL